MRVSASENESGTAGTRTQNQRIMSRREEGTFPEEIAVSAPSAVDGAVVCSQSRSDDDVRLRLLIDAWLTLSEETRDAIARLVGDDSHDVDDVTVAPAGEAGAR